MPFTTKKQLMKKIFRSLTVIVFCIAALPIFAAEISFSSTAHEIALGQEFEVKVLLDTQEENLNAISGTISFSGQHLRLKEIYEANSLVTLWVEPPHSVSDGIAFSGIIPGGYKGSDGLLFSLVFQAVTEGDSTIGVNFAEALQNDGKGSKTVVSISLLPLSIDRTYAKPSIFSKDDTEPPESFTPIIAREPSLFNNQWFVSFVATDKGTGIARYEVKETSNIFDIPFASWVVVEGPYLLKDQDLRSIVYIRAVDKEGNSRTERINPLHLQRILFGYGYWQIVAVLIIIAAVGYWLWKRKT